MWIPEPKDPPPHHSTKILRQDSASKTNAMDSKPPQFDELGEIISYCNGVRTTTLWSGFPENMEYSKQKTGRIESLQQKIDEWVKRCEILLDQNEELDQERKALLSRCKVAEDLNKVYVRMYLEMQANYDDLARLAAKWRLCDDPPARDTLSEYLANEEEYIN